MQVWTGLNWKIANAKKIGVSTDICAGICRCMQREKRTLSKEKFLNNKISYDNSIFSIQGFLSLKRIQINVWLVTSLCFRVNYDDLKDSKNSRRKFLHSILFFDSILQRIYLLAESIRPLQKQTWRCISAVHLHQWKHLQQYFF